MPDFADLLRQGAGNAWLFAPSAILLGALHGLEPGHSKTMMAAFIVAIRGTVAQAVMLGLAATLSHTAVVWAIALGGMYLWQDVDAETFEPYMQLVSAVMIISIALWMVWRTWKDQQAAKSEMAEHDHDDHPAHAVDVRHVDTGYGVVTLEMFEAGVPPRWRFFADQGRRWAAEEVSIVTIRPNGDRQAFAFADRGNYLESVDEIPEPHEFLARLTIGRDGHLQNYDLTFTEDHDHGHAHDHDELQGLVVSAEGYQDAHARAHANDIRRKFASREASTGQIIMFGLTGGLIPCPASITVLLLCLQFKQITLGAGLVLCFSIGLALTLVLVGAAAAISVKHATKRFSWFGAMAQKAPYLSSGLIILVGGYVGYHGLVGVLSR